MKEANEAVVDNGEGGAIELRDMMPCMRAIHYSLDREVVASAGGEKYYTANVKNPRRTAGEETEHDGSRE